MKYITSLINPEIKSIVKLHNAKERRETNKCIFQGIRTIETALESGLELDKIYITQDNLKNTINLFNKFNLSEKLIRIVSDHIINKISTLKTNPGLVAIFYNKKFDINKLNEGLVLAQIMDPGNMGTLIRTAASCNIKSIVIVEGTDPWSTKVIQASAGTIALVNIFELSWSELLKIKEKNKLKLYALVPQNGYSIDSIKKDNALLVVGNEGNGLPNQWIENCDKSITLKMPGNTESLNAAVAGSIALYLTFCKNI